MKTAAKPPRCAVCQHPQVLEINRALIQPRASTRKISLVFGPHYKAIERHRDAHLPLAFREVASEAVALAVVEQLPEGSTPHERAEALMAKAQSLMEAAEKRKEYGTAIKAVREMRGCIELMAKLAGELDGTIVNIFAGPTWVTMQTSILVALDPYPEARQAVLKALAAP